MAWFTFTLVLLTFESVQTDDPLTFIEEFQKRFEVQNIEGLPRFFGGLVGYFGYDTVRYVEPRLANSAPEDTLNTPDIMLMVSEEVVVFDNIRGRMQLIGLVDPDQDGAAEAMQKHLQQRAEQLQLPIQGLTQGFRIRRGGIPKRSRENPRVHARWGCYAGGPCSAHVNSI